MKSFLSGFDDITLLAVLRDECGFGPFSACQYDA